MSSKLKILSVLLLATALAGCGSSGTITGSIPGGNGGNNGGGGGDIGGGDNGGGDNGGGNNGGGDNGGGGNGGGDPATHELKGKFLRFSEVDAGDNDIVSGSMTATVAAGGQSADVAASAAGLTVPDRMGLAKLPGVPVAYGTGEDNFLDLGQSGQHYTIGTYVTREAGDWFVGTAVGGEKTQDQISGTANYSGNVRGALIPTSYSTELGTGVDEIHPYELTGKVQLELKTDAANATTVSGEITNVAVTGLQAFDTGQITFREAAVVNGAYSGDVDVNLSGMVATATGAGDYEGAFYGPDAAETAGTFEASGNVNNVGLVTPYKVIGSFGAGK